MKPAHLVKEYLEHLAVIRRSPETIRKARCSLREFVNWLADVAGVDGIEKLRPDQLTKWHAHLSAIKTLRGHPIKATSINRHIATVKGFLDHLARAGYLHARIVEHLPYVTEPRLLPGSVLAHGQVRSLLDSMPTDTPMRYRNRAILELLYSSGLRSGEVLGLDLDKVDYRNGTAMVTGKGNKDRVVPIGRTALMYLENYVRAVRPYAVKDNSEKAVFIGSDGKRFSYQSLLRLVHSCAAKAAVPVNVTPHTFRRSCTTELIRGGANIYHIKELLGHESLETLKHYARLTITDLKKTHEKCHPREKDGDRAPDG